MTDKHTPGPWKAIFDEEAGWYKVFGPRNEYIVSNGNTHTANARLIASAPETKAQRDELLEVLEALDYTFSDYESGQTVKNERQLAIAIEAIMPQARAAIKAAKGDA